MGAVNGKWWPVVVPDHYGPRCSMHPFDPYSLTHILHGVVFFLLLCAIPDLIFFHSSPNDDSTISDRLPSWWTLQYAAILAVLLEILWEFIENSDFVIQKFRTASGTSSNYRGDSYQNSLGDIVSATSGYWITLYFDSIGSLWLSGALFLTLELINLYYIRDGLVLTVVQLVFDVDVIKVWQKELVDRLEAEKRQKKD